MTWIDEPQSLPDELCSGGTHQIDRCEVKYVHTCVTVFVKVCWMFRAGGRAPPGHYHAKEVVRSVDVSG